MSVFSTVAKTVTGAIAKELLNSLSSETKWKLVKANASVIGEAALKYVRKHPQRATGLLAIGAGAAAGLYIASRFMKKN